MTENISNFVTQPQLVAQTERSVHHRHDESRETVGVQFIEDARMSARNVDVFYNFGEKQAIKNVSLDIGEREVLSMIGPSGCGKSTFLRCLNRMNDTVDGCMINGSITLDSEDIYSKEQEIVELRSQVGMVFQRPNPFPKSVYDNISYGPRLHGLVDTKADMDLVVEESLTKAGLWDEVKDRLHHPATGLSGGQQQRLCIARTIAISPEVILMDEPCSALDPIATEVIEELIHDLKKQFSIVIVTHSMQQALRVSDRTAYFHLGDLIEINKTQEVFHNPQHRLTRDYISGRFG